MSWQFIFEGISEALRLIVTLDAEVMEITVRSLQTSGYATLLATLLGLPLAVLIALYNFPGRRFTRLVFNSLVGVPTVTLGLLLYTLFSRSGPLGDLGLLYSVEGIAVGQAVLVLPLMVTFIASALESKERKIRDLVKTLGASDFEIALAVIREAYAGVSLAILSGFNRAFAELGIATMIGANIKDVTRVLTTAIALEKDQGMFGLSFALSIILLVVVFSLNYLVSYLRDD
ncbi:MAG: ABC transporter permease [Candidatus Bathyarchaeota archaeon]|nr:ABC transporter permease [Candidatus Bathyarchaeota archaeon]